jgi:hypothetical protein
MNGFLRPLVFVLALLGAGAAVAQKRPPPADPAQAPAPADSVKRAERQAGGEVIRAEPMQRDGRNVIRYKVLTADGRVRVMQDDPQARDARQQRRDAQPRRPERDRGNEQRDEESSDPI